MVKEAVRKELTQCQHCWRSRLELGKNARLSKCAGCQTVLYCSKECQKAAWPSHKTLCRLNSATRAAMGDEYKTDSLKKLQAFCPKHRPSFARLGIYAFADLKADVTRCMREVIYIRVAPNPYWDGKRAETAFLAFDIEVVPVEYFGEEQGREMGVQLRAFHEEQRRVGRESGFMVSFHDASSGVANICGVGFGKEWLDDLVVGRDWKEPLMNALNTGKVF